MRVLREFVVEERKSEGNEEDERKVFLEREYLKKKCLKGRERENEETSIIF